MQKLLREDWDQMAEAGTRFEQGDFTGAIEILTDVRSRTSDPRELTSILLNEAQSYRLLRDFTNAHAACDRAIKLSEDDDEGNVSGWIVKTDVLVDEGRFSDALDVIERSLNRYPWIERNQQLLRKAELLAHNGQHTEAIPILNSLLGAPEFQDSEIATINHTLGVSYGTLADYKNALRHFQRAQVPDLPEGYRANNSFWLAKVASVQGDFGSAKHHLLNALVQAEHSNVDLVNEVYESLANVSRQLGDRVDAAKYDDLLRASKRVSGSR
jgi:tetratricopeptide (TPR) repeat protein